MTESRTWFTIKAKAKPDDDETDGDEAEVLIYDEIGRWGVDAAAFDRALKAVGNVKTINMRINSPGGDSFAGIAIYNMLKQHPATINAHVDGIAASAASLIAMAGDRITMPENTFMVVHEPVALAIGPATVMRSMADDLDRVSVSYANTYAGRSGQTLEAVRSLMAEDRLMNAAECKERGYCDETTSPATMQASFALDRLPEKHRAMLSSLFESAAPGPTMLSVAGSESGGAADPPGDSSVSSEGPAPGGSPSPGATPPDTETSTEAPELGTPELAVNPPPAASYGPEDITATLELCALAGVPAAAAQRYITAKTPVAEVRAALLESRAAEGDRAVIVPHQTEGEAGPAGPRASPDIVAGKRRLQTIIKCMEREKVSADQAAALVDSGQWKP